MRIPYSRCVVFFFGTDDLMGFISKNFNALHESCDARGVLVKLVILWCAVCIHVSLRHQTIEL